MKLRQMTREGAHAFLEAAKEFCPEFHPLFLMALRAGLRKGELLAVRWGDNQFGIGDSDPNRYIVVQRNYVTVVSRHLRARNRVGRHVTRVALRFTGTEGQANAGGVL
jgi:integrase